MQTEQLLFQGLFLDWEGIVLNAECVSAAKVVITRLVKGRLSDITKRVVVDVPRGHENITLVLECEDFLPYSIQVVSFVYD